MKSSQRCANMERSLTLSIRAPAHAEAAAALFDGAEARTGKGGPVLLSYLRVAPTTRQCFTPRHVRFRSSMGSTVLITYATDAPDEQPAEAVSSVHHDRAPGVLSAAFQSGCTEHYQFGVHGENPNDRGTMESLHSELRLTF
jgi:transposase InsO family protein